MRTYCIAGNWKMHKNEEKAQSYFNSFVPLVKDVTNRDIIIAVPSTLLPLAHRALLGTNVSVAAQNMYFEEEGAFTGELSPLHVKEFATHVIIGHSERRTYFNEDNELLNKKIHAALKHNLKVIYCVGETQEQRDEKQTAQVVQTQVTEGLKDVEMMHLKDIVIAYEPVWAIGTGLTATPREAEDVHIFIRKVVEHLYDKGISESIRVIYGGSVKPENAKEILAMPNIDGCLPGGASLVSSKFADIVKSA